MTVSNTTSKVTYAGNGATTAFPTTFPFFAATEIEVVERTVATGAEAVKVKDIDYTVSGGVGAAGTVTALAAPPATVQWVIRRVTSKTQDIDYVENDPFPAETHEEGLDRAAMRAIELQEQIDRAPKFPVSDPAASVGDLPNSVARSGRVAGYDGAGNPAASATVTLADLDGLADDAAAAAASAAAASASAASAASAAVTALDAKITVSASPPSGGADGDIWFTVT